MVNTYDDMQKFGRDGLDQTMKSATAISKVLQVLAVETMDYSKKIFEEGTGTMEKLMAARSVERAIEIQTEYAKAAYGAMMTQTARVNDLMVGLAREVMNPFDALLVRPKAR